MPLIELVTEINAPIERCFDLACSIDFHVATASKTQEQAVAGVTSGLIGLNQTVTWRAKHFGLWQELTVKILEFERPYHFRDDMVNGAFQTLSHVHRFERVGENTRMTDRFSFSSPLGPLGWLVDTLFLKQYMTQFLVERNQLLKETAESDQWQRYL